VLTFALDFEAALRSLTTTGLEIFERCVFEQHVAPRQPTAAMNVPLRCDRRSPRDRTL